MPSPSSAVNSGPRRLSQAHGITETCRNSQPTCSAASCSSPADRPDVQSQAKFRIVKLAIRGSHYTHCDHYNLSQHMRQIPRYTTLYELLSCGEPCRRMGRG